MSVPAVILALAAFGLAAAGEQTPARLEQRPGFRGGGVDFRAPVADRALLEAVVTLVVPESGLVDDRGARESNGEFQEIKTQ